MRIILTALMVFVLSCGPSGGGRYDLNSDVSAEKAEAEKDQRIQDSIERRRDMLDSMNIELQAINDSLIKLFKDRQEYAWKLEKILDDHKINYKNHAR